MNTPLISVIVCIYNVEKYLRKCIDSIQKQSYTNLEIILVDDGSEDLCPLICDEFAKADSRIRVIHKKNGGLSEARNVGLDIARGDYIGFVDGDDYIKSDMYEHLFREIVKADADMAVCNFTYVDDRYNYIENRNFLMPVLDEILDSEEYIKRLTAQCGWYFVTVWNKLYKKRLFDDLRFPVGKQHEDEFLIHHLVFRCERIVCVKLSLYYYVQRADSIMGQKQILKMMDYGDALIDRYYFAKSKGNCMLQYNTIKRLTARMEEWEKLSRAVPVYRRKYHQLWRRTIFLIFEKMAWDEYNLHGRIYMRIKFIVPQIAEKIMNLLKNKFNY